MSARTSGRRSPPPAVWLGLALLAAVVLFSVGLGLLIWQEVDRTQVLQAEVATLRDERQELQARLAVLQGTAAAMESRLAVLEASDLNRQMAADQAVALADVDPQELDSLQASVSEIEAEVATLESSLAALTAQVKALNSASSDVGGTLPPEVRLSITPQQQGHNLSCESAAASMVAHYRGVSLSEAEVLAALPRSDNPHLGFRGNVDGPFGGVEDYGVYAGPILAILNSKGLPAWLVAGGLEGIKAAVARGNPVIAWVTYNCLPSTPVQTTIDGQAVALVPNQHAVVVTGYNADGVWANDPYKGGEDFYATADFERAIGYFGDMAIEVAAP